MGVIAPGVSPDTQYFWDGVAHDKLMLRRCSECGAIQTPAQSEPMCGDCLHIGFEVFEASGRGSVYSYLNSVHPSRPDDAPRVAALVRLEEGPRLLSNLVDIDIDEVRNEMPVEVCFVEYEGVKLHQFRPVGAA